MDLTMIRTPEKKGRVQKIKEFIKPPTPMERIREAGVIQKESGFIPWLNVRDLEQRREEINSILTSVEGQTLTEQMQKSVVDKTFKLFFLSGSPWYRGLDNRELSGKVSKFLQLYNRIGRLPAWTSDLFMCSMHLLHLSFQAIDVTNTPVYITQIMNVPQKGQPIPFGNEGTPPTEAPQ
jgi:hypothetical protein